MQSERGKAFEDNEPTLSEDEIAAAHDDGRIVLSLKLKPRLSADGEHVAYMAVKLLLCDGSEPTTILFDRMAAEVMGHWAQTMKTYDWKTSSMQPGPSRH
jgi:hypothetical protein